MFYFVKSINYSLREFLPSSETRVNNLYDVIPMSLQTAQKLTDAKTLYSLSSSLYSQNMKSVSPVSPALSLSYALYVLS